MKLTKENYELLMFDLLEGNLSAKEEEILLDEIEKDPFFAQEWRLFSETILEPGPIEFKGKEALLKKEKAIVIPLRSRFQILSYAAAIVAIFLSVFWFVQRDKGLDQSLQQAASGPFQNPVQEMPAQEAPSTNVVPEIAIQAVPQRKNARKEEHDLDEGTAPIVPEVLPEIKEQKQAIVKHEDQGENTVSPTPEKDNQSDLKFNEELNPVREAVVDLSPVNSNNPIEIDDHTKDTEQDLENVLKPGLNKFSAEPVVAYTGLRAFLRRSTRRMIAPFKNPKIKFAKVKDEEKPAINILFSSDAYYASAIVHLR